MMMTMTMMIMTTTMNMMTIVMIMMTMNTGVEKEGGNNNFLWGEEPLKSLEMFP